jgi:hypothetical protein
MTTMTRQDCQRHLDVLDRLLDALEDLNLREISRPPIELAHRLERAGVFMSRGHTVPDLIERVFERQAPLLILRRQLRGHVAAAAREASQLPANLRTPATANGSGKPREMRQPSLGQATFRPLHRGSLIAVKDLSFHWPDP